jgi:hypothetical protein
VGIPTIPQGTGRAHDAAVGLGPHRDRGAEAAATATAEPELEPGGFRSSACGLAACPPSVLQPLVAWRT